MPEAGEDVDFGERHRGAADTTSLGSDRATQLGENAALDFDNLFLGVENLRLVFLQLRRGKTFGIDQRLFAFVVGGRVVQVRLRDFDVVTENRVELNLQRADAGAQALALFNLREILLAIARQNAKFVESSVNAAGNYTAIVEG